MGTITLPDRLITPSEYRKLLGGISKTTFWRYERSQLLAKRRKIGPGRHGYLLSECLERIKAA